MIKAHSRRKLSRTSSHRQALLRNMSTSLILNEKITTTMPKAKELQRFVERLITLAKAGREKSFRSVSRDIKDRKVLEKLYGVISERYGARKGGYTRLFNAGYRKGDAASMAVIKLIQ